MLALLGGAMVRFIPSIGQFLGKWLEGLDSDRREAKNVELQIKLEEAKAKNALAARRLDAETEKVLAGMAASLSELKNLAEDRRSARSFASALQQAITATLETGRAMALDRRLLGLGWLLALLVEVSTAAVQPFIAFTVFGVWTGFKVSMFLKALDGSGAAADAFAATWGVEDWMLLEAVIGFFLAGRALARDRAAGGSSSGG